jgi:arylsulfatase A-like enzyme
VPLIVRDPRASAAGSRGRVVESFTENVDLMPTLLSWLGADVPLACDGHSLLPFLEAGRAPEGWRRDVHFEFDFRDVQGDAPGRLLGLAPNESALAVLRDERGKYVHFAGLPPLFFDLERDPGEHEDLAGDPAVLPRVLDYAQRMLSWRMGHAEQALTHLHLGPGGVFERRDGLRR